MSIHGEKAQAPHRVLTVRELRALVAQLDKADVDDNAVVKVRQTMGGKAISITVDSDEVSTP